MVSDPLSDMLARIKNAAQRQHAQIVIPFSKLKMEIAEVLKQEGYIVGYEFSEKDNKGQITITLKYKNGRSPFREIKRVSRPGLRRYASTDQIPRVLNNMGIAILSTSQGVMAGHRARKLGIGGEILCLIW